MQRTLSPETCPDISGVIRSYGDQLLENIEEHGEDTGSIFTGQAGAALVLMELFRQFRETHYLQAADAILHRMAADGQSKGTRDYSLYTGRGRVVYLLICRHSIDGNGQWLEKGVDLMRPCNEDYLHSFYTSDNLYDGRSGTLLLLLQLYRLTRQTILLPYIEQFADKIAGNALLSPDGIFWKAAEEYNLRPVCGIAFGNAGIRYVLHKLNVMFPDPAWQFLLDGADRYIDSCWSEAMANWADHSRNISSPDELQIYKEERSKGSGSFFQPNDAIGWANGMTGVLLSGCDLINTEKYNVIKDRLRAALAIPSQWPSGLYEGIAGVGLGLLELGRALWDGELRRIADELSGRPCDPGNLYFLVKSLNAGRPEENILFPFRRQEAEIDGSKRSSVTRLSNLRASMLGEHFPRTIAIMHRMLPDRTRKFLERPYDAGWQNEMDAFVHFTPEAASSMLNGRESRRIEDVLNLERSRMQFLYADTRYFTELYIDELLHREKVMAWMGQMDEAWMDMPLKVSPDIALVETKWDWRMLDDFKSMKHKKTLELHIKNQEEPPSSYTYIIRRSCKWGTIEFCLNRDVKMLLDCFAGGNSVRGAIAAIKSYLQTLTRQELKGFLADIKYKDAFDMDDFMQTLEAKVIEYVRPWLYSNILITSNT